MAQSQSNTSKSVQTPKKQQNTQMVCNQQQTEFFNRQQCKTGKMVKHN